MTNYIFPGTFDPITYGHVSVIREFLHMMKKHDKLIIAISLSPMKKPILSIEERIKVANSFFSKSDLFGKNIFVERIVGNTAEFIHSRNAICIRGIRDLQDLKYESYWPVSRSSRNPVSHFALIPIFNEDSKSISSSFFKIQIAEFLKNNLDLSFDNFYLSLKNIAPFESILAFYQHYHTKEFFTQTKMQDMRILKLKQYEYQKGCFIADFNIIDYGHLDFIKNIRNLTNELVIIVPEIIEHQKISFEERLSLIKKVIKNDIEIIIIPDISALQQKFFHQNNINQYFLEIREYNTRSDQKLLEIFSRISFLAGNNIELLIILQEKFRDISQPLIFNIAFDNYEQQNFYKLENNNHLLEKFIPQESCELVNKYVNESSRLAFKLANEYTSESPQLAI